jgi:hypothetical protein
MREREREIVHLNIHGRNGTVRSSSFYLFFSFIQHEERVLLYTTV